MQFKPTKGKVLVSLIPVYFLVFLIPVLPMIVDLPLFLYGDSLNTSVGNFFLGIGLLVYSIFAILSIPFSLIFETIGLLNNRDVLPEISLFGLILLALIYSSLLYLIVSLFQKKRG